MTDTAVEDRPHREEQEPASAEITEPAAGVLRLQLPIMLPGLGHVNCYALRDDRGLILVDPGLPDPDSHRVLRDRLDAAGYGDTPIHTVLVTHSHPDHFGGAGRLHLTEDAAIVAHRSFRSPFHPGEPLVEGEGPEPRIGMLTPEELAMYRQRLEEVLFGDGPLPEIPDRRTPWGGVAYRPSAFELEYMRGWDEVTKRGLLTPPTVRVVDGEAITIGGRIWTVVHTPGHTGDHICLWNRDEGVLLSGDHVLPTITPHISGLTEQEDSLAEFFGGLRRIAELPDVDIALPAHGHPFRNVAERAEAIVEHHVDRLGRVEEIGAELGPATVIDFSHHLFKERSWGPMAESETFAHLEHLRHTGRAEQVPGEDGLTRYRITA